MLQEGVRVGRLRPESCRWNQFYIGQIVCVNCVIIKLVLKEEKRRGDDLTYWRRFLAGTTFVLR